MHELPFVLLVGLVVLTLVTLVGHGIWVALAAVFGRGKRAGRKCMFCGRTTSETAVCCEWCGRDLQSARAAELADLEAVERQLRRFRANKTLKPEAVDRLLARLETYRQEEFAPRPKRQPAPIVAQIVEEAPPVVEPPVVAPPVVVPAAKPQPIAVAQLRPVVEIESPAPAPVVAPEPPAPPKPVAPPKPAAPPKPVLPPAPRRSWSEVLAGFMEERNIRWGELIGGLLIICSSVALLASFWDRLSQNPYTPFSIFVATCAAIFGVGLYAHHRWKLESTSRGMLIIATLLVPLDYVALAGPMKGHWTLWTVVVEILSLALFTWLVSLAARVLVPTARWLAVVAVIGNSIAVLLVARLLTPALITPESSPWALVAIGALPVALFAISIAGHLRRGASFQLASGGGAMSGTGKMSGIGKLETRPTASRLDTTALAVLFTLLGITAFSTAVPLGLLVAQAIRLRDVRDVLPPLSILLASAALPVLSAGLTVVRGTRRDKALGAYHLAGTMVALAAMTLMLVAVCLAWPHPLWLIAVGLIEAAALAFAAFHWRVPVLHAGAIACVALAYLTAFHLLRGSLTTAPSSQDLFLAIISARSGTALAGLFLVLAVASEWLARQGRLRHGIFYMGSAAAVAVIGLVQVTFYGLGWGFGYGQANDPLRGAVLYAIYGAGSLALVARWRRVELSYLGLALLAASPLWALWWNPATHHVGTLWAAVIAGESLLMAVAAVALQRRFGGVWDDILTRLWEASAVVAEAGGAVRPGEVARKLRPAAGLSVADLYRLPLAHVAEMVAMLGTVMTVATCWLDRAAISAAPTPAPVIAAFLLAVVCFLLAWEHRSAWRTWLGSLITLAGAAHTLGLNYTEFVAAPWVVALLGHATAGLIAAVVTERWTTRGLRFLTQPLADSALLSSALALPVLIWTRSPGAWWLACCLPWLAAIWLVLAWRKRDPLLFACHQAALAAGTLAAATMWLTHAGWLVGRPLPPEPNLLDRIASVGQAVLEPRNLQVYGIALGLFAIVWIAVRIVARFVAPASAGMPAGQSHSGQPAATGPADLLQLPWTVDRVLRNFLVIAQFAALALFLVPPEIAQELIGGAAWPPVVSTNAFGPAAWLLLVVLGAMLVFALWERWQEPELVSAVLLAAAVPCVAASLASPDVAVASALRWALAAVFVAGSAAMWQRQRVLAWCRALGTGVQIGREGPLIARAVLTAVTALPVLAITLVAAMLQLGGAAPAGPLPATWFDRLGAQWSYLVPLMLVMAGMVGHALRERSAGYAFSAGLVLEMAVVLGYALQTKLSGGAFNMKFAATLVQLATIAAGLWAIAWLAARKWVDVWRDGVLMNIQLGMAIAGNVVLIGAALLTLVFVPVTWNHQWAIAAGLPLGWVALILPLAASQFRGRLRPGAVGLFGMAALALLACTVRGLGDHWQLDVEAAWGYRTLMLGWAIYALLVVLATWWVASLRTAPDALGPPQALVRMAAVWVRIAAIAAVLLGLKTASWDTGEQLWAAATIAVASAAGATMAVWRRREGWAFAAALGVNLAASLAVWHFELLQQHVFEQYWVRLVQANVIASAAVALVWLAARKRLYELRDLTVGQSPLLALQTALACLGTAVVLVLPVLSLVQNPDRLPAWMAELAAPAGWIGLLLAAAAAGWYTRQTLPGQLTHVFCALLLGLGVLVACTVGPFDQRFQTYHALESAWAAAVLLMLGSGIAAHKLRVPWFRASLVPPWLTFAGTLVVALAVLHSWIDPDQPWWAAGTVLAMSFAAGVTALWLRQHTQVYVSGLLLNVAGTLAWWTWGPTGFNGWTSLLQTNVICLAIGSIVWSLLDRFVRQAFQPDMYGQDARDARNVRLESLTYGLPPFAQVAAACGTSLVALVIAVGVADLGQMPHRWTVMPLDWLALGAIAVAAAIGLLDRTARFPLPSLYTLGLAAVGMGLCARELPQHAFFLSAATEMAIYLLATALVGGALPLVRGWFSLAQMVLALVAAAIATWITLDPAFDDVGHRLALFAAIGRTSGATALLLTLLAAVTMSGKAESAWRTTWQNLTLALGVFLLAGIGWAMLPADIAAPWLHRSVVLMVAAAAVTLISGFGLRSVLPPVSDWIERGRQCVPALAGLAMLALIAVLAQEVALFEQPAGTPMEFWAIAIVAVALVGLIAAMLAFAVLPALDPLRLSENGRQAYIYAVEALAVVVGLHVYMTLPNLFHGLISKYWMFVVMAVAFLGAGVSEWFHRRKLPVLSQPLERTAIVLPLLPAVGFWFMLPGDFWNLTSRTPALWFLMGLFYGVMAVTRRSPLFTVLAVVAANFGLWVALYDHQIRFDRHPQLWLVPLALAGLVAEHLNRNRLTEAQRTAFRYLALSVIYVSSTADMYIDWTLHLGRDWQLPLVLMLLSVAGALAGILLRVRSFLYLGVTFLTLDLVSMICHADANYPWIKWATGILVGLAIFALFAVFEKRRNDVLAAVERLKEWRE